MIIPIIILALNCPNPKVINKTKTWVKLDEQTFNRAKKRCGEIYPEAPCLKTFIKKEERAYQAICGV